ncbi:DUF6011 domain-containing protein [Gordonia sputi]
MSNLDSTNTPAGYSEHFIDPADKLLRAALRDGTLILAVRCRCCGAALTATKSKAIGAGPTCRRNEAADRRQRTEGAA